MQQNEQDTIRLLIAHDSQIIREGLRLLLSESSEIATVGDAASLPETLRRVGELQPDVLLLELYMQGQDGLRAIELIRGEWPQVAILVFTSHPPDEDIIHALRAGVCGYVTLYTERPALLHAIRTAARGDIFLHMKHLAHLLTRIESPPLNTHAPPALRKTESDLTGREQEILQRVASGERNKEIAAHLCISEPTVKSHLASIYFKLGVDSRASAVAVAIERGVLSVQRKAL